HYCSVPDNHYAGLLLLLWTTILPDHRVHNRGDNKGNCRFESASSGLHCRQHTRSQKTAGFPMPHHALHFHCVLLPYGRSILIIRSSDIPINLYISFFLTFVV